MSKPYLKIIAGCNGSGKSTYSSSYVNGIKPFDFDSRFLQQYALMSDSELRYEMAMQATIDEFESSIQGAFFNGKNFCYETNFDTHPIAWAKKALEFGYALELIFFCIDSLDTARERVLSRVRNNGHFVNNQTVFYKWKEGYRNLNIHFKMFDRILIVENSSLKRRPRNICSLVKNLDGDFQVELYDDIPSYSRRRFPNIHRLIKYS